MSEKRDAQREVTRIALSGIAGFGFALAGSGAIREHGVIDRPTEDVDLFTTTRDPVEFVRAIERVSKDLRERGYEVGEVRRATWFARLRVRAADGARLENVESLDFSRTDEGRVMLALDEGRGRRTTARLMSDGILRFSAVTTALMTASTSLDIGGIRSGQSRVRCTRPRSRARDRGDRERTPPLSRGASARPGRKRLPAAGRLGAADDAQSGPPQRNRWKGDP